MRGAEIRFFKFQSNGEKRENQMFILLSYHYPVAPFKPVHVNRNHNSLLITEGKLFYFTVVPEIISEIGIKKTKTRACKI